MQKVFDEVTTLDKKCYEKYALSEDILMEHAATAILDYISKKFKRDKTVFIVSGAGNNGADGIALARLLHGFYKVKLYLPYGAKSNMAKLQLKRANLVGVRISDKIYKSDIIVDCLFGSGLTRALDEKSQKIIQRLNKIDGFKIACDIPSGINSNGQISPICFNADTTITMGALKKSLFTDFSKDYVGKITVANLGVQRELYEDKTDKFLLDKQDIKLPLRKKKSSHKGNFGHLAVVVGDKKGAGLLASEAGFIFGCGLITVISKNEIKKIPNHIMQNKTLPQNTTAICLGMGLGKTCDKNLLNNNIPKVIDADFFYNKDIVNILDNKNIALTPHPKEFCSLLKLCNIADISIDELQNNRFTYLEYFSKKYPKVTILLKGANVLIAQNKKIYINTMGTSLLSKGGSGDVLSGLIGSLLAQGYDTLNATISGSLAHTMAALNYDENNYSLTPEELIKQIKKL
ncbi:MAG: NAD(P)H-hydrate dehydratase [Arcobacteraceae bacterium]|nr:NAD(P)H-hydrate dehydratase [Arcobacteraceae bacterium]